MHAQDSLKGMSYEELDALSLEAIRQGDVEKARIYSDRYIRNAKQNGDSLEVGRAFYSYIISSEDEEALKYADSTIVYTQNSEHRSYPTFGYLTKGRLLYQLGRMDESLEAYLTANVYAKLKGNIKHQNSVKIAMASIKDYVGQFSEALVLHQEIYKGLTERPDYKENDYALYMTSVHNLSLSFLRNGMVDSALYYSRLGLKESFARDTSQYIKMVALNAINDFYKGNLHQSLDTLLKYYGNFDRNALANKYYYIAKSYQSKNDLENAIHYFKKVDSVVKATNDPFPEVKDVYQQLMLYEKSTGNVQKQLHYIDEYVWADSILSSSTGQMMTMIDLEYDMPRILAEKARLQDRAKESRVRLSWTLAIGTLLVAFILLLYLRERRIRLKVKKLLGEDVEYNAGNRKPQKQSKKNYVPSEIEHEILKSLSEFEQIKGYLDMEITVPKLAQKIGTNDTYLSNVINNHKGVHFPTYLKDLRITHAVRSLKVDEKLLRYSVKGLANEFGFKTDGAFTRAFKERVGVKPTQFIKGLGKNNKEK